MSQSSWKLHVASEQYNSNIFHDTFMVGGEEKKGGSTRGRVSPSTPYLSQPLATFLLVSYPLFLLLEPSDTVSTMLSQLIPILKVIYQSCGMNILCLNKIYFHKFFNEQVNTWEKVHPNSTIKKTKQKNKSWMNSWYLSHWHFTCIFSFSRNLQKFSICWTLEILTSF